jgi:hypothetical protein
MKLHLNFLAAFFSTELLYVKATDWLNYSASEFPLLVSRSDGFCVHVCVVVLHFVI